MQPNQKITEITIFKLISSEQSVDGEPPDPLSLSLWGLDFFSDDEVSRVFWELK